MLPSRSQYKRWSLPTKWSFWAAVIGIPLGIASLAPAVMTLFEPSVNDIAQHRLLLQTAQELRYNDALLTSLALAVEKRATTIPAGSLKTEALISLVSSRYGLVVQHAYGEEKHIYQRAILLKDLGVLLGSPKSIKDLDVFNRRSESSLHDIHFLNNFLHWYVSPVIAQHLDKNDLYSLGWGGLPGDEFRIAGVRTLQLRQFQSDDQPLVKYVDYLSLID